jgi:hypothetical protein
MGLGRGGGVNRAKGPRPPFFFCRFLRSAWCVGVGIHWHGHGDGHGHEASGQLLLATCYLSTGAATASGYLATASTTAALIACAYNAKNVHITHSH